MIGNAHGFREFAESQYQFGWWLARQRDNARRHPRVSAAQIALAVMAQVFFGLRSLLPEFVLRGFCAHLSQNVRQFFSCIGIRCLVTFWRSTGANCVADSCGKLRRVGAINNLSFRPVMLV